MARAIDHLVLAVRDLDLAGSFYELLGFQVGARNRHPWGTENRLIQLDGSFLELVSIADPTLIPEPAPRVFSFGAFVRDFLRAGEGFAMLVLASQDAKADAKAFAKAGIGDFEPFHFARSGRRPDGSETRVAFTLAFAEDTLAPKAGFFACQHHHPENFWNAAFQAHPNRATALASAAMVAENPTDHHVFIAAFAGERALRASSLGVSAVLPRGQLDVLTPHAANARYGVAHAGEGRLIGFCVRVPDTDGQARRLQAAGIRFDKAGQRLVVPPAVAFGTAVAFEGDPPGELR